jgi:uncharacterized protein YxeA
VEGQSNSVTKCLTVVAILASSFKQSNSLFKVQKTRAYIKSSVKLKKFNQDGDKERSCSCQRNLVVHKRNGKNFIYEYAAFYFVAKRPGDVEAFFPAHSSVHP